MELDNIKIDFDSMKDFDSVNIEDLKSEIESNLEELNVLKKVNNKGIKSDGLFEDNIWAIESNLHHVYKYIDFRELEPLIFKGLSKQEITVIKCWIGSLIIDKPSITGSSLTKKLKSIITIIKETNNFYYDKDNGEDESMVSSVIDSLELSDKAQSDFLYDVLEYLNFIEPLSLSDMDYRISKYQLEIRNLKKKYKVEYVPRKLPTSKDIILFSEHLEYFFEHNTDLDLKIVYFPILIWWKLTNVIPMRISELCRNLSRDCLLEENDITYLKVRRVKNPDNNERTGLPILDKIAISEDIADIIREYISLTNDMGDSFTLFSYRAMLYSKDKLHLKNYNYMYLTQTKKYNQDYFSASIFASLLDSFYEDVIKRRLKCESIETKINPNDTRHFAFFSLLMQGVDPVEIALLGGHSNLRTQENYQHEISYYIDSELYKLINKRMEKSKSSNSKTTNKLKEIFRNLSVEPPKPLLECRPLKIGYCTCDFSGNSSCEDLDECSNCSKWWIYPSAENFNKKLQELKDKKLDSHIRKVKNTSAFLAEILSKSNINNVEENFFLDNESSNKIKTAINQIKSECKAINDIRENFIDYESLNNKLDIVNNINLID